MLFFLSFWHPYDLDLGTFGDIPEGLYTTLVFFNSFFFLLFWLNAYFFLMFQIVDSNPGFLPFTVVPCTFFFISLSVTFISSFMLLPYSVGSLGILITSVLNSASDRLVISVLFSSFSGVCSILFF